MTEESNRRRRDFSIAAIGIGVGALTGRLMSYLSMRNDLAAIERNIARGRELSRAIRNHRILRDRESAAQSHQPYAEVKDSPSESNQSYRAPQSHS